MTLKEGLAFVWRESWAFLARGWWLALLAGVPYTLSEMVRWALATPEIGPFLAASSLTAVLDACLYLVVIRFVTGGHSLRRAIRVDTAALRRFAPFASITILSGMAQYYLFLIDDSLGSYALAIAIVTVSGVLLAPWAVASATGAFACGPLRSIRMAAPHLVWSLALFAPLLALELAGGYLIGLVSLPVPDIRLGGMTFPDVEYDLQWLVFGSLLVVAGQVAIVAVAQRTGAAPDSHEALRETFS